MGTVVITGVSRGFGAALLDQLLSRGDRVVAIGRSYTKEQHEYARAVPERLVLCSADLGDRASIPTTQMLAAQLDGATEVALIHSAGVVTPIGAVGALPADATAEAVAVNLTAPMLLTNAFLAAVPPSAQDIRILFVSSSAARRIIGGWSVYCACKAGGEMFFEALAAQLRGDPRYTVVNVSPGVMDTDMQGAIRSAANAGVYFPDRERYLRLHARGELPSPAEVAQKIIAAHLTRKSV